MIHACRVIAAAVAILVAVLPASDPRAQELIWVTYESPGLGYRIEYPAALFGQPFPLQQGSDGFNVSSPDGRARLVVFGAPNTTGDTAETIADQLAAADDVDRVTYRRVTEQWLVLSGYLTNRDIFYERLEFNGDRSAISAFRLDFPEDQRDPYEPPIARMGRSLTPPAN